MLFVHHQKYSTVQNIIFVIATRAKKENFFTDTATGKSLKFYDYPFVSLDLYTENSKGLSEIYNLSIEKYLDEDVVIVFAHDDLHILDFYWARHLFEGLHAYDLIGLVGNKTRSPMQASWAFLDTQGTWDKSENLSGIVGHGNKFPGDSLGIFGSSGEVKLLDGLFLAAKSETFKKSNIRFDARFKFHFYDMDICRSASESGLRLGTIPLSVIHESKGDFSSANWLESYHAYIKKWNN
jgi:GT2 family glycosyltransferase